MTPTTVRQVQVKQPANNLPAVRVIAPSTAATSPISTPTVVASIVATAPRHTIVTASSPVDGAAMTYSVDGNNKLPISKLRGQCKPKERKSSHNVIEKRYRTSYCNVHIIEFYSH